MFLWLQERVSVIQKIVSFPCVHGNKYFHACTGRNTIYHLQKRIQVGAVPDILQVHVQERAYTIRKMIKARKSTLSGLCDTIIMITILPVVSIARRRRENFGGYDHII